MLRLFKMCRLSATNAREVAEQDLFDIQRPKLGLLPTPRRDSTGSVSRNSFSELFSSKKAFHGALRIMHLGKYRKEPAKADLVTQIG